MKTNLKKFIVEKNVPIIDSIKKLDEAGEKIVFVVDENERLFGALADSDIRRWILQGNSLHEKVEFVCNQNPYYVTENYSLSEIKEKLILKNFSCVPVLGANKNIVELLFWNEIFDKKQIQQSYEKLDLPVVIMAGGKGTRLEPLTRVLPKPLIPIGDKTIIEMIIDRFLDYQIENFYITLNHKSKIIKSFFEELSPQYNIHYVSEDKPLGTAGSLRLLRNKIKGSVFVTNCDIIVKADYFKLYKFHTEKQNDITIVSSLKHYKIPYGICEIENGGTLNKINEKPEYNFLVNTGMYIINMDLIDLIPENENFHATDLIETAKNSGKRVGVFPISENSWIDTGEWEEYKNALVKLQIHD